MSTEKSLLPGATRDLAAFAAKLQYNDIPREAIERMKLSVLDSIGSLETRLNKKGDTGGGAAR